MTLSDNVVAVCFAYQKCIFKKVKIFGYCYMICLELKGCIDCVRELCRIDETADIAHNRICKCGKQTVIF